jgi:hypothetical protein
MARITLLKRCGTEVTGGGRRAAIGTAPLQPFHLSRKKADCFSAPFSVKVKQGAAFGPPWTHFLEPAAGSISRGPRGAA